MVNEVVLMSHLLSLAPLFLERNTKPPIYNISTTQKHLKAKQNCLGICLVVICCCCRGFTYCDASKLSQTKTKTKTKMTYPPPKSASSVAAELSSSNEEWDGVDNLLPRASVVLSSSPSSKREPLHHRHDQPISTFQPAAAASTTPLDDFLSGKQDKKFPFGFTLSIPCRSQIDALEDAEQSSCSGESAVSELTLMTYRAELMKEVSFVQ